MNYSLGASFSSSFDGKDGLMIVKKKRGRRKKSTTRVVPQMNIVPTERSVGTFCTKNSKGAREMRYITAGELHGPQLTVILEGVPAGLTLAAGTY